MMQLEYVAIAALPTVQPCGVYVINLYCDVLRKRVRRLVYGPDVDLDYHNIHGSPASSDQAAP